MLINAKNPAVCVLYRVDELRDKFNDLSIVVPIQYLEKPRDAHLRKSFYN